MDYDLDRTEIRKAFKNQKAAEEHHRKLTKSLIFAYAAELLRNQKTKTVISTVISFSIAAEIYLQDKLHFTKKETYEIHKAGWAIYKKQKQRDTKSCVDCRYSYIDDLYNELNCSNENHRKEKGGLAENDPLSPKTSKPCCKYYSD